MRRRLTAVVVGLLLGGWLSTTSAAQPFSAEIQRALAVFVTTAHTWTATQTFSGGVSVTGPISVAQGTLTADAQALSTSATWNAVGVTFTHWKATITDTASAAASLAVAIRGGAAGTTDLLTLSKAGALTTAASVTSPLFIYPTNPATTGIIRLGNAAGSVINFRNAANDANLEAFSTDAANKVYLGYGGSSVQIGNAQAVSVGGSLTVASLRLSTLSHSATAPTISSGFGASPSIAASNGTGAFTVNVGTGGAASAGVVGMPSSTTGWACGVENLTATAANRADQRTVQTASTTSTVTIQNQTISTGAALAWTASDIVRLLCVGY